MGFKWLTGDSSPDPPALSDAFVQSGFLIGRRHQLPGKRTALTHG
jgi:hypothetical protein